MDNKPESYNCFEGNIHGQQTREHVLPICWKTNVWVLG
jgi:hypothetical protein